MDLSNNIKNIIKDLIGDVDIVQEFFNILNIPYFHDTSFLFFLHDNNNTIVYINNYAKKVVGDVVGLASWSIYASSLTGVYDCPAKKCIKLNKKIKIKDTIMSQDGSLIQVLIIAIPIHINNKVKFVAEYCINLKEVTNVRQKILSSELKFQKLFDEVPCYIFIVDKKYKILSANKRIVEDIDVNIGDYCYKVHGSKEICKNCKLEEAIKDGTPKNFEGLIKSKNGDNKEVLIWLSPIKEGDDNISSIMEMIIDVTEIKKMQRYLANLGLFLSSVSHEIKNMFTALDGCIYKINKGINNSDLDFVKENIGYLDHLLFRIKRMVVDILDYAKQRRLFLKKVSVKFIIDYIKDIILPKLQSYNINFRIIHPKSDFSIYIDDQKFISALVNILDNAIDACVMDRLKKEHKIELYITRKKNKAFFRVKDNGVGIDEEKLDEIFEPFYSSKGSKGTGLGLFITKEIIEKHGGKISVSSQKNKGSEFVVEMPIYHISS